VASKGKIAALVADAFQEEEYFFPKVALNDCGRDAGIKNNSHRDDGINRARR